jgi:hypothetical protein
MGTHRPAEGGMDHGCGPPVTPPARRRRRPFASGWVADGAGILTLLSCCGQCPGGGRRIVEAAFLVVFASETATQAGTACDDLSSNISTFQFRLIFLPSYLGVGSNGICILRGDGCLGLDNFRQQPRPRLQRRTFLFVVTIPLVDRRHRTVCHAPVVQHVRDMKPIPASFTYEGGRRAAKIVGME